MDALLKFDVGPFTAALSALSGRDVQIAGVWALNDTAADVHAHIADRMEVAFDRPTRFTKNAFTVVKARQGHLEAAVEQRRMSGGRHYLRVQEEGGPRPQTGIEKLISRGLVHEGVIQAIIPGDGARLDAHGNWSKGEMTQVLSALKVQRDKTANETEASRKRNPNRARYFVPKRGLTPGIYKKDRAGNIGIVAVFTAKVPVYQQRLGFYEGAAEVYAARMPQHLRRTLGRMIAKRFG